MVKQSGIKNTKTNQGSTVQVDPVNTCKIHKPKVEKNKQHGSSEKKLAKQ